MGPENLEINLVKMPSRVRLGATFAQICRDHRPEMVHPIVTRDLVLAPYT
jgi:hypothetical protein